MSFLSAGCSFVGIDVASCRLLRLDLFPSVISKANFFTLNLFVTCEWVLKQLNNCWRGVWSANLLLTPTSSNHFPLPIRFIYQPSCIAPHFLTVKGLHAAKKGSINGEQIHAVLMCCGLFNSLSWVLTKLLERLSWRKGLHEKPTAITVGVTVPLSSTSWDDRCVYWTRLV